MYNNVETIMQHDNQTDTKCILFANKPFAKWLKVAFIFPCN